MDFSGTLLVYVLGTLINSRMPDPLAFFYFGVLDYETVSLGGGMRSSQQSVSRVTALVNMQKLAKPPPLFFEITIQVEEIAQLEINLPHSVRT